MARKPREGAAATASAVEALRDSLIRGDLAPGQRLVESELAEDFGVTRNSVRAALIALAAAGLVERIPNRGARVRVVSVEEAVAITECRMVLEGLCAARAARLATDEQIAALQEIGRQMQEAVNAGEPLKYSALNREMHGQVRELGAQPVANSLLDRLNGQLVRHQFRLSLRPGRPRVSLAEHLAIIEGIARHDPDGAEAAARAHLASVITALEASEDQ